MKKLMLLGGSRYLLPVIETAHRLGIYVITCDYIPENIAHEYSDEYVNISIIEKDKVLDKALELGIDGIMSFACDPGVVTAAFVAEKMCLPFQCSYESAMILQDKGLFRTFLSEHGFNVPKARRYEDRMAPFRDLSYFNWPVIVKPTDSAGSKGVTKVDSPEGLEEAIELAISQSHNFAYIIEDFITFDGYHSSADPFTIEGKLVFSTYSDQLFDSDADNPYTPAFIIWPSSMKKEHQSFLDMEIQRLLSLLNVKTGIYNIESCVGIDGKPYIMEVSPRGGGCKIAEIQNRAFGLDLIENEVRKSVGLPLVEIDANECDGIWCEMVIHAKSGQSGSFREIKINSDFEREHVKCMDLSVKSGDVVHPFTGANMALGDMFLQFVTREELDKAIANIGEWLTIVLD